MKRKHSNRWISLFIFLCFLFTGCGDSSQSVVGGADKPENYIEMSERLNKKGTYVIEELSSTNPLIGIYKEAGEDVKLYLGDPVLSGGTVFQVVKANNAEEQRSRLFLQKLEKPYQEWQVKEMDSRFTVNEEEYTFGDYFYSQGNPIYASVYKYNEATHEDDCYLASCNEEGDVQKILGAVPKSIKMNSTSQLVVEDLTHIYGYAYENGKSQVIVLTPDMQVTKEATVSKRINGIFADIKNDRVYLMRNEWEGFGIFNLDNEVIVQDSVITPSNSYGAGVVSDGTILVCDNQKLWQCKKGEEPTLLCDFVLNNYIFGAIYGMEVQEDDTVLVLLEENGKTCLVKVVPDTQEAKSEKQEVIIAFGSPHRAMARVISDFNRQSDTYTVTAIIQDENETEEDFNRTMQFEISAGKGPDILSDDFLYMRVEGYMRNGYFASLDDVLDSVEPYVASAFGGGKVNGVLYGIPYDFRLRLLATYTQDFAGERDYWTLPDFMEAVEAAEPQAIMKDFSAYNIIFWFGLYDNSNKEFIDWEEGESHLTEEPFLELVRFAEKYGENEEVKNMDEGVALRKQMTVGTYTDVTMLYKFAELDELFKGKAANIGYPRTDKKGVYVSSRYLYVNSSSKQIEGAKEFLRFLLSEEEQKRFGEVSGSGNGWIAELPVNRKALDYLIELQNIRAVEAKNVIKSIYMSPYFCTGLNEEQAKELKELAENALPNTFYADGISDIVYEELGTYFDGSKTLEEAVAILDRRVQLYLNERK